MRCVVSVCVGVCGAGCECPRHGVHLQRQEAKASLRCAWRSPPRRAWLILCRRANLERRLGDGPFAVSFGIVI
jgi:hypothetical protein